MESIYLPLKQDEGNYLPKENTNQNTNRKARVTTRKLFIFGHLVLLGVYAIGLWLVSHKRPNDESCTAELSTYSPALPHVKYQQRMHNADIVQTNKYRGTPTSGIDAEWLRIGLGPAGIRLDEDDLRRLNKSDMPERLLHRIPEEFGGGYPATLEVFHLLHCLDSLRKATYSEYYAEEIQRATKAAWRIHTDHCIDMIRETIMCSSDVTPITYYDNEAVPGRELPMPDFSALHTCRNFEGILSWNNNNNRALKWDKIGLNLGDDSLSYVSAPVEHACGEHSERDGCSNHSSHSPG